MKKCWEVLVKYSLCKNKLTGYRGEANKVFPSIFFFTLNNESELSLTIQLVSQCYDGRRRLRCLLQKKRRKIKKHCEFRGGRALYIIIISKKYHSFHDVLILDVKIFFKWNETKFEDIPWNGFWRLSNSVMHDKYCANKNSLFWSFNLKLANLYTRPWPWQNWDI